MSLPPALWHRTATAPATCFCVGTQAQPLPPPSVPEAPPTPGTEEAIDSAEAQHRFDSAASHTSVAVDGFAAPTPLVHLSELLAGQAGVVVNDRGNYAQDLQIAVRGFGARSTFGNAQLGAA